MSPLTDLEEEFETMQEVGVSPLGAKKAYPVLIDELAQVFDRIAVSAGQRGLQLFLQPEDLRRACNGVWAALSQ